MSKKINKSKGFFEAPEIWNMDDLGYMADEMIEDRAQRLESERNRMLSSGKDPQLWEVEIAYIRREQQLRKTRSELHQEYLKKFNVDMNSAELDFHVNSDTDKVLN
jgi:hypothetical protein